MVTETVEKVDNEIKFDKPVELRLTEEQVAKLKEALGDDFIIEQSDQDFDNLDFVSDDIPLTTEEPRVGEDRLPF